MNRNLMLAAFVGKRAAGGDSGGNSGGNSGGGGESGTFTLDADSSIVTIPVSKKCTGFSIWYDGLPDISAFSPYQITAVSAIDDTILFCSFMNYNNTALAGASEGLPTANDKSYARFYDDSIQVKVLLAGSGKQVFVTGLVYNWVAW
jgi:hypothetical protein